MDFNNSEIKENIILYIAKPFSQSKYIENLACFIYTNTTSEKTIQKSCLK